MAINFIDGYRIAHQGETFIIEAASLEAALGVFRRFYRAERDINFPTDGDPEFIEKISGVQVVDPAPPAGGGGRNG